MVNLLLETLQGVNNTVKQLKLAIITLKEIFLNHKLSYLNFPENGICTQVYA